MRLNKFLAERLGISRREADILIARDEVTADGITATLGMQISPGAKVVCRGKVVPSEVEYKYIMLNKPVGYVCSRKKQGEKETIYSLLPASFLPFKPVGRLDSDSSGLLLLTNDGDFAFEMTHPKFYKLKTYEVELDRPLEPLHQQEVSDFGLILDDGKSKLGLTRLDDTRKHWLVEMSEGRNRQIRRTFAAIGYEVKKLHRLTFGPYELGDLPSGKYQQVSKQ